MMMLLTFDTYKVVAAIDQAGMLMDFPSPSLSASPHQNTLPLNLNVRFQAQVPTPYLVALIALVVKAQVLEKHHDQRPSVVIKTIPLLLVRLSH